MHELKGRYIEASEGHNRALQIRIIHSEAPRKDVAIAASFHCLGIAFREQGAVYWSC